jgi:hypothetical protein
MLSLEGLRISLNPDGHFESDIQEILSLVATTPAKNHLRDFSFEHVVPDGYGFLGGWLKVTTL